jgi:hypothetical protein
MLPRNLFRLANVAVSSTTPAVAVHALSALNAVFFSSSPAIYQAKPASAAASEPAVKKPSEGDPMSLKSPGPVFENIHKAYRDLLILADFNPDGAFRNPPFPQTSGLHRVLQQIKTKEDVPIAVKALNLALTKGIQIDVRAATMFARNCAAVGDVDTPMERFGNPAKYRMFLTTHAATGLLTAVGEMKDLEKLKKLLAVIRVAHIETPAQKKGAKQGFDLRFCTSRAFASCGDFASAFAAWDRMMAEDSRMKGNTIFPYIALLSRLGKDSAEMAATISKFDPSTMAFFIGKFLPAFKSFVAARNERLQQKHQLPQLVQQVGLLQS